MGDERQLGIIDNMKWQTMGIPVKLWWQIIGNDWPRRMTDNGELNTMEMTDNRGWKTIGNYIQWEITGNGKYQINDDVR